MLRSVLHEKPVTSPLDITASSHYTTHSSVRQHSVRGAAVHISYRLLDRLKSQLMTNERGANILEYTLLISVIALVAMVAVALVGQATTDNIMPVLDHL